MSTACDACLARAWLLARLAGRIEIARRRDAVLPELLGLRDGRLVRAVAGDDAPRILAEHTAFDPGAARLAVAQADLVALCRHDAAYPARLRHAADAPHALFAGGRVGRIAELGDEDRRVVAIVGARRASRDALEVARALGRDLALAGVPVVSGMALGVDAAAQAGSLDGSGLSVAVLAGGADTPYPPSKHRLHAELLSRGLVLSELPPGVRPRRWTFPARNRIIAGLADLTVVVEAAERSGSLITAELALKLGRDVAAVPGSVLSSRAAGSNALLHDGAAVVRSAQDVLDVLYGAGGAPALRRTGHDLEPHLAELLEAVGDGRDTVAALAGGGMDAAGETLAGLTELELRGLVRREPGGRYGVVL